MVNLGSLFGQSSPPLLGLDISTSGVRLVELVDAGKIDGCGFFGIYRYILLPIAAPAFAVVLLLAPRFSVWLALSTISPPLPCSESARTMPCWLTIAP